MSIPNLKRIFLSPPHMSGEEMRLIKKAFESNYIAPLGPMVDSFEREFAEYVGIKHRLALSSGTAAIQLALKNVSVGLGDEIFASTLTCIGSVSPIIFEGATPVFIDSDISSWNMDLNLLETELAACEKKGKLPKTVIPTDLYGQCCELPRMIEICDRYGVPVICDAAEALGAVYYSANSELGMLNSKLEEQEHINQLKISNSKLKIAHHAGVGAKAAVYSFNGNKIITTSGGGMLASDDEGLIEYARKLSQQAREDFVHYEHEEIGYNYRMSNVLAAIGRGQLRVLDERVERKREIFEHYESALGGLAGIEFMPEPEWSRSNRWLTVVLITPEEFGADREEVRLALEAENIEARPLWKPMHMQTVFDCGSGFRVQGSEVRAKKAKTRFKARVVGGGVAEDLFERGLCLPSGTAMTNGDLDRVVETILRSRAKTPSRKERKDIGQG